MAKRRRSSSAIWANGCGASWIDGDPFESLPEARSLLGESVHEFDLPEDRRDGRAAAARELAIVVGLAEAIAAIGSTMRRTVTRSVAHTWTGERLLDWTGGATSPDAHTGPTPTTT